MYPVTSRFLGALRESHTAISRVDLMRLGDVVASDIPVLSGYVTDDTSALVRRRAGVSVAPTSAVLAMLSQAVPAGGGLWPLGNELKLWGGIRYIDGIEELVPMGVYRISRPRLVDTPDGMTVSVECFDRSRSVSRNRFTEPYVIPLGTNYATAIQALVQDRIAWQTTFDFMATTYTTPALVFTMDDDPWQVATDMAKSMGAELFFDGDGKCVLRPEPNPLFTPSSFQYAKGEEATVTSVTRDLDDEQAYNGVVVTSTNSDLAVPIRSEAWDTDVNSPTYYDPNNPAASVYGAVPYFISTQYITTQTQADDAAAANLARVMGVMESIEFNAINNPAHEGGDVIEVIDNDIGVNSVYILDAVRIGIGESYIMGGTTRRRRAA